MGPGLRRRDERGWGCASSYVMAGHVPAIRDFAAGTLFVAARHKAGHDKSEKRPAPTPSLASP